MSRRAARVRPGSEPRAELYFAAFFPLGFRASAAVEMRWVMPPPSPIPPLTHAPPWAGREASAPRVSTSMRSGPERHAARACASA